MAQDARSSKRRKLNDTVSIDASTIQNSTPKPRPTPRYGIQGRHIVWRNTEASLATTMNTNGRSQNSRSTAGVTAREREEDGPDIYDDIDGALSSGPRTNGLDKERVKDLDKPASPGTPNRVAKTSRATLNGSHTTTRKRHSHQEVDCSDKKQSSVPPLTKGKAVDGTAAVSAGRSKSNAVTSTRRSSPTKPGENVSGGDAVMGEALDFSANDNTSPSDASSVSREESATRSWQPRRVWPASTSFNSSRLHDTDDEGRAITSSMRTWSKGRPIVEQKSQRGPPENPSAKEPETERLELEDALPSSARVTKHVLSQDIRNLSGTQETLVRNIVLEKLAYRRPIPLVGFDVEFKKVYQMAEQTVAAGEGNSMLVIGSRGSGKTTLMNEVVKKLARENTSDFHIIRLNGFVHTDDKLALREIWRQLGREMEVEDDGTSKSYADTLSKLLALLSHPSELAGEHSNAVAKAVIFIIDEFDLFANHPRQTLLYNLFDIAQSRKAPIAVFGLTTRIDVAESLEKRVKSRFSHRYVHLSQAKSLETFKDICKSAICLGADELHFDEKSALTPAAPSNVTTKTKNISPLEHWNGAVEKLFKNSDFLEAFISPHYYLSKSVSAVLGSIYLPLSLSDAGSLPPGPNTFDMATAALLSSCPPDSNLSLLPTLSSLSLALIISAARCSIIHDTDVLNFRIAFAEYSSLASKARIATASSGALAVGAGTGTRVWGKEVARGCWEELVRLGLLIPALGGDGDCKEVGEKGMVRVDVALEEILPSCPGMEKSMERWCRQI